MVSEARLRIFAIRAFYILLLFLFNPKFDKFERISRRKARQFKCLRQFSVRNPLDFIEIQETAKI